MLLVPFVYGLLQERLAYVADPLALDRSDGSHPVADPRVGELRAVADDVEEQNLARVWARWLDEGLVQAQDFAQARRFVPAGDIDVGARVFLDGVVQDLWVLAVLVLFQKEVAVAVAEPHLLPVQGAPGQGD